MSYCDQNYYYSHCSDGKFTGWFDHNSILSIGADVVIALVAIGVVWWLAWFLFYYRRRPFCVFCQVDGERTRVKVDELYKGRPACYQHRMEHLAADEPIYECPRHHLRMKKEIDWDDEIIYDSCPQGCSFYDEQEVETMLDNARAAGHSSGMATGMAMGIAINSGQHH